LKSLETAVNENLTQEGILSKVLEVVD